jgi:hypothetical protein
MTTVISTATIQEQINNHIERLRDDALMVHQREHAESALWFIEYEVREIRRLLAQ